LVFIKTLKTLKKKEKNILFVHTAKSLKAKRKNKNHIVFLYNKKNFKKYIYILACILALITSLLKS